jgi:hypothetical protein
MKKFNYKGYEIIEFPYDYSRDKNYKWQAHNTNNCDETIIVSKTFDDILDEIDHRVNNKF